MPINEIQHRSAAGNYQNKLADKPDSLKKSLAIIKELNDRDILRGALNGVAEIRNTATGVPGSQYSGSIKSNSPTVVVLVISTALSVLRPDMARLSTHHGCLALSCSSDNPILQSTPFLSGAHDIAQQQQASNSAAKPHSVLDMAYRKLAQAIDTIKTYDPLTFPAAAAGNVRHHQRIRNAYRLLHTSPIKDAHGRYSPVIYDVTDREIAARLFDCLTGGHVALNNDARQLVPALQLIISDEKGQRIERSVSSDGQRNNIISYDDYIKTHCKIRTKTNEGTFLGDTLLLSSEYVRNPFRAGYEGILHWFVPQHRESNAEVALTELINLGADIVLGTETVGLYPLFKQGISLGLKIGGHTINKDSICVKDDLTPTEIASQLFNLDLTVPQGGIQYSMLGKIEPEELKDSVPFKPDGFIVQEGVPSGIHQVKYLMVKHQGMQYKIKHKGNDEYWAYKFPGGENDSEAQRVYYDEKNKKLHFNSDMPDDQGMDIHIENGKSFISLHGENHEIEYDWQENKYRVAIRKNNDTLRYEYVYFEPLSKRWFLENHNSLRVFDFFHANRVDHLEEPFQKNYYYQPKANSNPARYGNGIIFEVSQKENNSTQVLYEVIELHGRLLRVRTAGDISRDVRYEVFNDLIMSGRGFPVEWDGARWLFEINTTPQVSQQLKDAISPDMYAKDVDARKLSIPDNRGLRWDAEKYAYLKVDSDYLKLQYRGAVYFTIVGQTINHMVKYVEGKFEYEYVASRFNM